MQGDILDNNDSDESEVDVLGELQTVWINHKILSCILFTLFIAKAGFIQVGRYCYWSTTVSINQPPPPEINVLFW